jgi:ATP-binding cassette subfamily B protein
MYDVKGGAVRLGGLDVRDVTLQSLRDAVGVVTQDAHMFHDTIRANLRTPRRTPSDADLWAASTPRRSATSCARCRRPRHARRRPRLPPVGR